MADKSNTKQVRNISPSHFTPQEWIAETHICRSTYFNLPKDCKPQAVKIGRRIIILETPEAWLQRMSARGGIHSQELAA